MSAERYDIVTVGGGIGGASLARIMAENGARVLVLEREKAFKDRVRGEALLPWGVGEARRLGIYELLKQNCAHEQPWFDFYLGPMQMMHRNLPETTPQAAPEPAAEPERLAGFACAEKPVTGTGPGFDSSRDHSEQTAKEAWLKKAQGFYSDAAWDTAKDFGLTCVKQGLYSKCFASAVPCGAKKAAAAETPKADAPRSN